MNVHTIISNEFHIFISFKFLISISIIILFILITSYYKVFDLSNFGLDIKVTHQLQIIINLLIKIHYHF